MELGLEAEKGCTVRARFVAGGSGCRQGCCRRARGWEHEDEDESKE